MFRIFSRNFAKLQKTQLRELARNSKKLTTLSRRLTAFINNAIRENKYKDTKSQEKIQGFLRSILALLHNEDDEAKEAIKLELERELKDD